jgi:hypothetical protein
MIPLVSWHSKNCQRASSVAKPWPGGEKRTAVWVSHHEERRNDGVVAPLVCATAWSLLARGCLSGATPRGQPWTSAVPLASGRNGARGGWRCCRRCAHPLWVAPCTAMTAQCGVTLIPAPACHPTMTSGSNRQGRRPRSGQTERERHSHWH